MMAEREETITVSKDAAALLVGRWQKQREGSEEMKSEARMKIGGRWRWQSNVPLIGGTKSERFCTDVTEDPYRHAHLQFVPDTKPNEAKLCRLQMPRSSGGKWPMLPVRVDTVWYAIKNRAEFYLLVETLPLSSIFWTRKTWWLIDIQLAEVCFIQITAGAKHQRAQQREIKWRWRGGKKKEVMDGDRGDAARVGDREEMRRRAKRPLMCVSWSSLLFRTHVGLVNIFNRTLWSQPCWKRMLMTQWSLNTKEWPINTHTHTLISNLEVHLL